MLTKDDLQAIQKMFDSSKKETNDRFASVDNKITSLSNTFSGLINTVDGLSNTVNALSGSVKSFSNRLQKNTEDLVELITTGFNAQDAGFNRIEKILINHEKRIGTLEKIIFKTN